MARIDYIFQKHGENVVFVRYKSGKYRTVVLDGSGLYAITKTQRDYMENARRFFVADGFFKAVYWACDDSTIIEDLETIAEYQQALAGVVAI